MGRLAGARVCRREVSDSLIQNARHLAKQSGVVVNTDAGVVLKAGAGSDTSCYD